VLQRLNEDADTALISAVWLPLSEAIGSDPRAFMEAFGLELPQRKLGRTMAQIFTSKGKGAKLEPETKPVPKPAPKPARKQALRPQRKAYRLCTADTSAVGKAYPL
jgi:hypothetical protein